MKDMSYKEFTLESVKDFILRNGGRVTNHELVTHFKSHLNDQNLKGVNREKFKDFVNTLATIKVQEKGEKVLVLKKKFRPEYDAATSQNDPTRAMSEPPDQKQTSKNQDNLDGGNISKFRSEGNISTSSLDPSTKDSTGASTLSMSSVASSTSLECQIEDDPNASVVSVKDKVQHLNRMTSQTELQAVPMMQKRKDPRFSHNKDGGDVDDDSHSSGSGYVTLDTEEKEWLVTCSAADYHPMAKILSKNSSIAKLRVGIISFTALHWAAKHGKSDVVKLLAGYLKPSEFNQRTVRVTRHYI
ncbi:hypothetical protein KUTeg_019163 [Tegillarca granosa]|uniref:SOWAHA-C winged helix-turn-helix domain-containing protein n=1 Tax=Tegillarca granosa TaxID=220873 RepID=A0ABQ9EBR8_TEGGR|nr:hypothetical protein KUTeg_019163 [Tegillarca granosa]